MTTVDRKDDMGTGTLRLIVEDGGDVLVVLRLPEYWPMSVKFCAPGTGGGKSPRTHKALRDLSRAMQEDNEGLEPAPAEQAPRPLPDGVRGLFTPPFKVDPSDPERVVDALGNIAAGRMFYNAHWESWGWERFRHLPYGNELYDAWCEWFDTDARDGADVAQMLNETWGTTP